VGIRTMNGIGNQFGSGLGFNDFFSHDKKPLAFNDLLKDVSKNDDQKQNLSTHDLLKFGEDKLKSFSADHHSSNRSSDIGLKLVYRSLSNRFENFSNQKLSPETPEKANNDNTFDFKDVAKNVLDFVSSTLKGAKANGASDEKIASLFKQARTGVEQGFKDALDELGGINVLDDSLAAGISQSRDLIDQGINKLEQQLQPSQVSTADNGDKSNTVAPIPINKPITTPINAPTNSPSQAATQAVQTNINYQSYAASSLSNSSDLSITTADGDVVSISFSDYRENSSSQQFDYASNGNGEQFGVQSSQSSYRETNFSFSVNGNLDEGEKKAIGDLLNSISKIEKSFFNGNLDKAFKQAQKLGYDSSELTGFSLDLQQTQTSVVSQAYSEVSQFNDNPHADEIAHHIQPVIDFANQYQQANNQADRLFGNNDNQMKNLLDSVFNAEFGQQQDMLDRLNSFLEKLA